MSTPFTITFDRVDGPEIPLGQFALLFVGTQWTWSLNNRCKHLTMFMDTRKRTVRVFDRDDRALTWDELAYQLQLPSRPVGEEDWHWRDIPADELRQAFALAARLIEAGEVDRRALLTRVQKLETALRALDQSFGRVQPPEVLALIDNALKPEPEHA